MQNTIALYRSGFRNWHQALGLAITHEWLQRTGKNEFHTVAMLIEPFILIFSGLLIRVWLRHQLPNFGTSSAVFHASGVIPYYLFIRLSTRGRSTRYEASQRLPRTTSTDHALAAVIVETCMFLASALIFFLGMWLYGLDEAKPWSMPECLTAMALLTILGIGVGLACSAIAYLVPPWAYIWPQISRALMFASGAFYVMDLVPERIRNMFVWNPLAHAIEWFRLGLYGSYPHTTLDKNYLVVWALASLLVGIVAHSATLRRVRP